MTSAFYCQRCGNCCRHRGEVRVSVEEVAALAGFLDLPMTAFTERFQKWPDGFRALALAKLRANDDKGAYAAARKALAATNAVSNHENPDRTDHGPKGQRHSPSGSVSVASSNQSSVGASPIRVKR